MTKIQIDGPGFYYCKNGNKEFIVELESEVHSAFGTIWVSKNLGQQKKWKPDGNPLIETLHVDAAQLCGIGQISRKLPYCKGGVWGPKHDKALKILIAIEVAAGMAVTSENIYELVKKWTESGLT